MSVACWISLGKKSPRRALGKLAGQNSRRSQFLHPAVGAEDFGSKLLGRTATLRREKVTGIEDCRCCAQCTFISSSDHWSLYTNSQPNSDHCWDFLTVITGQLHCACLSSVSVCQQWSPNSDLWCFLCSCTVPSIKPGVDGDFGEHMHKPHDGSVPCDYNEHMLANQGARQAQTLTHKQTICDPSQCTQSTARWLSCPCAISASRPGLTP